MNILTKISVVVLVVLILIAVPVFISMAMVPANYHQAYLEKSTEADMNRASAQHAALAVRVAADQRQLAEATAATAVKEKQTVIDQLNADVAAARTTASQQKNELSRIGTQMVSLAKNYEANSAQTAELRKQLEQARLEMDKLNKLNLEQKGLLDQSEAEKTRIEAIARNHAEKVRDLEEQLEKVKQQGVVAASAEQEPTVVSTEKITGSINAINGNAASVNVGSAVGLKKGMKLTIYRGADFVARLRVEEVNLNEAAGIVVDRRLDPVQGDKVTSARLTE